MTSLRCFWTASDGRSQAGGGGRDLHLSAAASESPNPDQHTGAGRTASVFPGLQFDLQHRFEMRERFKRKNRDETAGGAGAELTAWPGAPAAGSWEPAGPRLPGSKKDAKCSIYDSNKVYLGVRVKMPVRDLLKNIRLSQGGLPLEDQGQEKRVKVDKKRVNTRAARQMLRRKHASKSLEELAIIVEVLEEDLRTSTNHGSSPPPFQPPQSPNSNPVGKSGAGYNSDEMIPSPEAYLTSSPGKAGYQQVPSPPGFMSSGLQICSMSGGDGQMQDWTEPPSPDWDLNSSFFFWTQLQREECVLGGITDAVLLRTDIHGRTSLHQVACIGKRALGYCIAKRMVVLNSLDLRDSAGMTALLHAASHNHHLMVADLIHLGADVNVKNNSGKSCLHLSAEKGYIRVLEVLKQAMIGGVYVDVEATDNSVCFSGHEGHHEGPGKWSILPLGQTPRPPPRADDGDAGVSPADG
ncbi:uncharacterized protein zgc:113279 isoform X2 [Takifugu flavidus]|uniref:uncharacterized protein zgc:113279 isoform X2 n=1 Tax=Takifugu flavidus TaxID=433684 RepID=UPI00254415A5|nr:uncharacterized protein zgc:113279 isoform X2 [Takifugu flavidus]